MDALVMCGGKGTRLDTATEKPLFEIGGRPMVDDVIDALRESAIETVHAVVSPHTPETKEHVSERGRDTDVRVIDAPGEGYVADLNEALGQVDQPVFTVAADLPLLASDCVNTVLAAHGTGSLTVCVPTALKNTLDVSADTTFERSGRSLAPTGVNIVGTNEDDSDGADDDMLVSWDARFAVNVNRQRDVPVAEALLSGRPE